MDTSTVSALLYRTSKPLGKVRRRVQDLRIPSSPCVDFVTSRPALDLSHNESARLAADSLLSRGLEGYHEVLNAEGEVDFLSELEKIYMLENGRDGDSADPGASDDDDKESESSSAGSQCATKCPATSTDSDPTVVGLDLSNHTDVKWTEPVLDKPCVEVYFQCDRRAAGVKDLVRGFIRKAGMALAIVMDSFSDVELLCDLLEASRKRNVSVHLLLDQLNLSLFVSMWQDLKLDSKNFPKLSVHSVNGQTYCAKTGRKLTGQIAESFIITDWTEVLTGSYSFSWLSWQVHRSLAILIKGSAVTPFHQEFLRLYSSSEPVPGFVTYITVPHTLPLYTTLHGAQTKAKTQFLPGLWCAELECSKVNTQPPQRAGTGTQNHDQRPQLYPKPLVQPGPLRTVTVDKLKPTMGAVCTQHGALTDVKPLGKNQTQIQNQSNLLSQALVSHVQSQLTRLTVTTTAERNGRAQESHGQHSCQSSLKPHLQRCNVATGGLFFRQRSKNRLTDASGIAAGQDKQRQQWKSSLSIKPKTHFQSDNPKLLSASTSQQKQGKRGLRFPLPHQRGNTSGQVSSQGTRRQDQPQKHHHQHSPQAHQTPEGTGSKPTSSVVGAQLKPHLPGTGATLHLQPHTSQQMRPAPRLNWMPESRTDRPRPVARHSSFDTTYGTGQKADGQVGWRPLHNRMNMSLGRSKSMTDRHSASLKPDKV